MHDIAPGFILQRMYVRQRCRTFRHREGFFYEFGAGNGGMSQLLLSLGYRGEAFDLNAEACENNRVRNVDAVRAGSLAVTNEDFLAVARKRLADIILSSMVVEHLPPERVAAYFGQCRELLKPGGVVITLVPAGMRFWGIEDEIAGHLRRYEADDFQTLASDAGLCVRHIAGLTFPVSNLLLPLSNFLVRRTEGSKRAIDLQERTVLSGNRDVLFKTKYPWYFRVLLNEVSLFPFFLMQSMFTRSSRCMVLYCEMTKR